MSPSQFLEFDSDLQRISALLGVADAVCLRHPPGQLFAEIFPHLQKVLTFDFLELALFDPLCESLTANLWEVSNGSFRLLQSPIDESFVGAVWRGQNAACIDDLERDKQLASEPPWLRQFEIRSYCALPLSTFERKLGVLRLAGKQPHSFAERDFSFLRRVAEMIALSLDATLSDEILVAELGKLRLLFEIATSAGCSDLDGCTTAMLSLIQKWANQDMAGLYVFDEETQTLHLHMADRDWAGKMTPGGSIPLEDTLTGQTFRTRSSTILDYSSLSVLPFDSVKRGLKLGVKALCLCPVVLANRALGVLKMARRAEDAFSPREFEFFERMAATVAGVLDRFLPAVGEQATRPADDGGSLSSSKPVLGQARSVGIFESKHRSAESSIPFMLPEALLESEELLTAYFSASKVGFCILDTDFRYVAINETLARMNGISVAEHLGKRIRDVVGGFAEVVEPYLQKVVATGQPVANLELSFILPRRSDPGYWIAHYIPIRNAAGKVRHIGAVVVEVTEQKKLAESLRSVSENLGLERKRHEVLTQITRLLEANWDVRGVFPRISAHLRRVLRQEYAALSLREEESGQLRRPAVDFPMARNVNIGEQIGAANVLTAKVLQQRSPLILGREEMRALDPRAALHASSEGLKSFCWVPLIRPKGPLGLLVLGSTRAEAFHNDDLSFLAQVAAQLAITLENETSGREIERLKQRLMQGKRMNAETSGPGIESRPHPQFEGIIGRSSSLERVFDEIDIVSDSDATVLILGETGTGKGLVAHAIHKTSKRKGHAFVTLNCAAIPTGLLESELFGHEKGAFTGAVNQKIGRLELADGGTLFLDEIGEIPLELQPKLLRVLQDHEFERLGGTRTIKVNLRLIAATNRDLAKSVIQKQFRSDLFYRLNVFPIRIPSLRERREDIPSLTHHFVQKFAKTLGREIETILPNTMDALIDWHWPGNVRELENFIERSVILTEGNTLIAPVEEFEIQASQPPEQSLKQAEREHIISVLRETGGILSGRTGAASRLGLKRTTLQSKMHRLGIAREDYSSNRKS